MRLIRWAVRGARLLLGRPVGRSEAAGATILIYRAAKQGQATPGEVLALAQTQPQCDASLAAPIPVVQGARYAL